MTEYGTNGQAEKARETAQEQADTVSGIVDSLIYQNEETGYTVCEIEDTGGNPVTICGIMPFLSEGDRLTARGAWVRHPTYGRQFRADAYDKTLPAEEGDILRYLASGAVKGIGPKTAQKIVDTFGTDSFDVIANHPDWLCEISGITKKKAAAINENFNAISGARSVMMFCRDFFTPQTAMKIYKKWGGAAVDRIRSNPYRLCEDFSGISFRRADQIAMNLGLDAASEERILHGAVYVLRNEAIRSGHTCLPRGDLVRCTHELLFADGTDPGGERADEQIRAIEEAVDRGIVSLKLIPYERGGTKYLFDARYYNAENYAAKKLKELDASCPKIAQGDAVKLIEKTEAQSALEFARAQKDALFSAMQHGVMILTGGPGTGKTTIIKGLISIFTSLDMTISLCAPTGRAAKRMSEATSYEAKTIHRLLEMDYAEGEDDARFLRDEANPLDADVLIVDEASMIDVLLMDSLLRAAKRGTRAIFIGDVDQLPSVGAGNVLADIIDSGRFHTVRLTEIFRQSGESLIVENAHRINEGLLPVLKRQGTDPADADFFYLRRNTEEEIRDTVVDLAANRLPRSYGEGVRPKIQVLTPSRKGLSGTDSLNFTLQAVLNPPAKGKPEHRSRDRIFRVGDRVMQTKNNYQIEWHTELGEEGLGIYNGDIGTVTGFDAEENLMEVRFDDRVCSLDFSQLDEVDHAYAVTVHKSQGSEYPYVIIPLYDCPPMLQTRNLLYTAVTRAAKMVILVGRPSVLERMVENNRHQERCTMLRAFLETV